MAKSCRYCLDEEGEFVSPCRCKGSVAYIHEDCLNKWLRSLDPEKETKCPICKDEIKTNYNFEKYIFNKKDPLNKHGFYWWVLTQLACGILLSRYDITLMHTLYIHMQIGIYIGYNSFIWHWWLTFRNKKLFLQHYLLPGQLIVGFTHTYILAFMYFSSELLDPITINWLFCIAHLLYPINIRDMNGAIDKVNKDIARQPRRWVM